jgi:HK97 family phage major capsid protein
MAYNNIISRTDAQALIPEQVSRVMLGNVVEQSAALALFARVGMATNQTRMPVLAALPVAYFVNGDTGLKQTTEVSWSNKFLNAEEIAAIVPIPEAVLDDASFDVWGTVRPLMETAVARALDAAILFGVNKPASWPAAIVPGAVAAGHAMARGTAAPEEGGIAQDFNSLFALVEDDGFDVNGVAASRRLRANLRGARDTTGQLLADLGAGEVWGVPLRFGARGLWPAGVDQPVAVLGDWAQGIVAVRQDVTYKILDQAVLQDGAGAIVYNLAQQDMVALRVVARYAFQVANTLNAEGPNDATQYPFAVLRTEAA